MFKEIFLFEITYRLKRPATWAYFGILLIFGLIFSIGGNGPASEKVFVNSPVAIATMLSVISIFGIMLSSAIMGVPVYRDIEHKTENYFFTYPITEKGYLLGRFLGSMSVLFLVSLGLHVGLIIGFAIGPFAGYIEADRFTDFNLWYYIQPTITIYWTNFFFAGCIFFTLVSLTKKVMLAYAGGAILFITYLITLTLTQDFENKNLVSLLDPFGSGTFNNIIRYWTPEEQNSQTVPFTGMLVWNRVIWVGLGLSALFFTLFRFNFQRFLNKNYTSKKKHDNLDAPKASAALTKIPEVSKMFSSALNLRLLFQLAFMELKNIVRDNFFKAILIAAVLFLFFDGWFGAPIYGTPSLPLTLYMLEVKDAIYIILIFILIVFMTGEVLHRERSVNYDQIFGSLPIPNIIVYGSKFLALVMISFILVNLVLVSGVINQVLKGYFNFEFDLYFIDLYLIEFPKYITFVMLAFFVHSIVTKKFMGHVIAIAIWAFLFALNNLAEIDNNLYLYSYAPGYTLSDMNGFGHFGEALLWFRTYWLACGAFLTIVGYLFWKRGTDSGFKARWHLAKERLNFKTISLLGLLLVVFFGAGAFINYNTKTLNKYTTNDANTLQRANYEKDLSKYDKIAQPKIIDVKVLADLIPEERSATIQTNYIMVNKSGETIDSLHLNWGAEGLLKKEVISFTINGKAPKLGKRYDDYGYEIYTFEIPLQPKDTLLLELKVAASYKGFPNEGSGSDIVYNGTFLNNSFFPSFGYDAQGELTSDQDRKKYELPIKDYQLPVQTDAWGTNNLLFNDDADYITFEGTVSTAPDQIAIMPGQLQKEWEENGRKYYHYKMNRKLNFFYNISSAKYAVHREVWTSATGKKVNIEIFHHPTHTYNLDRLVKGVKHSMDYYSENYGEYQHNQMRILEFPRYATFAQSFPNTVPFAESFGWVGNFSDPKDLDYVYLVTAHEVAHQWWGHQVTPSATRGANQISESMAEYSSLMVMKKEYGVDAMQDFLKDELDSYLRGRANESKFEKTLLDNDDQAYVWYRKGGLILYGLQDLIGESALNKSFKAYTTTAKYREPPFTTTIEWYNYMKKVTPDSLQYYLEDSFEKITLYSNKVTKATYKKLEDNKYEVTIEVESAKNYFDGNGKLLEEGSKANALDIGVFDNDIKNTQGMMVKSALILKKVWVQPGTSSFTYITNKVPVKAGIDPYNKMIDRIPDDNLIAVEKIFD
ncbi:MULTISPECIES: ABC transporter permease/M1 family aminopeptidase [unclassified Polaribacter]|uniref:ABC transporter permease/M1 family aminopeptidase n=1 Tax=unclassified Polaribacter TaxID=196858 RepID=UPI0011BD89D5|nr:MULTISPECIES: M1 family aminopeptidase [unclassified Polaribacter]TXD50614.1 peptidase M1 [Polaribacter sp. IC063]TXD57277.1 peptidase M1 [Polaribacter sp. IC066]